MSDLSFECVGSRPEKYAAAPTMIFRLKISESTGLDIRAIALRCQIRILPAQRRYSEAEAARLGDLFGEPPRWGDTLKPLQFATLSATVPPFTGQTEIDLPVPFTYDMEVAFAQYFHALDEGEIPLLMLFSGTIFGASEVSMVPWDRECGYRLPVSDWRALMEHYFPGAGWLRLTRETMDALQAYKHQRALPTWDSVMASLLKEADDGAS